jgi:hypothetical protein
MRLARLSCGLLFAAGLAWSSPCGAAPSVGVSPGLTLSVSLGDKLAFGLGLDARVTVLTGPEFHRAVPRNRYGLGPFLQLTWLDFSNAVRFAVGAHGGGELFSAFSMDGEIGWTYRTSLEKGRRGGHGIHLGILHTFYPAVELSTRLAVSWFGSKIVPEGIFGAGPRLPPFGFTDVSGTP